MFGLFKRTKIKEWEIELIRHVVRKLPENYSNLLNPIDEGIFTNVILDISDIPNLVSFGFNPEVYKKYSVKNQTAFKLTQITVFDKKTSTFLPYEIYISSGIIVSYSLKNFKKCDIDIEQIDVFKFKKELIGVSDYQKIAHIFNEEEKNILSHSEIYSVIINDKEYFHIMDLEDGNFIGINKDKIVYKVTHDPMEVVKVDKTIVEILS